MWIAPAAMCHTLRHKIYLHTTKYDHDDYFVFTHYTPFTQMLSKLYIFLTKDLSGMFLISLLLEFSRNFTTTTMETAEYWLMACEYAIWNATIASLQFWAEDLGPVTLGIASEGIYTNFFWTPTSHTLHQLSEDVSFGCFVIALNAAFTQQLSLADEGYKSGSNIADLHTPLWKTPCIHHMSSMKHASFDLAHTTPCSTATIMNCSSPQTPPRPVCHHLLFTSDSSEDDQDLASTPVHSDEEEDFQTVPLDDEHWTAEIVPEGTFCIHKNVLPNNVCQHPCPYGNSDTVSYMDSLDLSDISDYEDYLMTTSDDEELPGLEEVPY